MPQGSSAVRPTNGLYLYMFMSWVLTRIQVSDNHTFRVPLVSPHVTFVDISVPQWKRKHESTVYIINETRGQYWFDI